MFAAVKSCWALLLGIALIMLGNGLQGSLLGLRASIEGFSTATIGIVMTGYYAGFLVGSVLVPKLLKNVGHIRVFAALASLASVSALVHPVFLLPFTWILLRVITGFSYAGLYVVAESWLNDVATNENRGQLLAIYMVIMLAGTGAGQFLLNLSSPGGMELFILISVLVSLAVVPISLTVSPAPKFDAPEHIGIGALYRASPLGVVGAMGSGMNYGAIFSMGAVYGNSVGMPISWIAYFMASIYFGGMLLQWPVGRASDRLDRRQVILGVTVAAAVVMTVAAIVGKHSPIGLLVLTALFGGMSLPLYSLFIAHTNDHLRNEQMVAASATLVLVGGLGAIMGPTLCALVMSLMGPNGFFWYLVAVHAGLAGFAVYRMTCRASTPKDEQRECAPLSPRASPVAAAFVTQDWRDHRDQDMARLIRY